MFDAGIAELCNDVRGEAGRNRLGHVYNVHIRLCFVKLFAALYATPPGFFDQI